MYGIALKCLHCVLIVGGCLTLACSFVSASLARVDGLNKQVVSLYRAGKYAEAIPLAQRVLAIQEKTLGTDHPNVATAQMNLAGLYMAQARYADAEPLLKRALAIQEKTLGLGHLAALSTLVFLYDIQGRSAEAAAIMEKLKSRDR